MSSASLAAQRKTSKKQIRCQKLVQLDTGIVCSNDESQNIAVCNAGLSTGLQEQTLVAEASRFGAVMEIVMLPGKSYCFLKFADLYTARAVFDGMHGKSTIGQSSSVVYLSFCSQVPIQSNPWNQTLPDGLTVLSDFISAEEEQLLLSVVDSSDSSDSSETNLKNRFVKHFGYEFMYGSNNVDVTRPLVRTIPNECDYIWQRLASEAPHLGWHSPDQITLNKYQPGHGIPPHVDTHSAFADPILSLSLQDDVVMEFRNVKGAHVYVLLPRRSMLIMSGESRLGWTHGITPRMTDIVPTKCGLTVRHRKERISLTCRKLKMTACACNYPHYCDSRTAAAAVNTTSRDNSQPVDEHDLKSIAGQLELQNVHNVYNKIGDHFSETRHSPWPKVEEFLASLPTGAILIDIGCGNGKYLFDNKRIVKFGCDRSDVLLNVCRTRRFNVFRCDCLAIPLKDESVDACISIAVIHHLASSERRRSALAEMARVLVIGGRGLVYVWAKNQEADNSTSSYLRQNKRNFNGSNQSPVAESHAEYSMRQMSDFNLPVHTNRTHFKHQDILVPWKLKCNRTSDPGVAPAAAEEQTTYLRFYHVFGENELEALCKTIDCLEIRLSYYDQGNWCVIFEKIKQF